MIAEGVDPSAATMLTIDFARAFVLGIGIECPGDEGEPGTDTP